jgi:Rrf2 family protein
MFSKACEYGIKAAVYIAGQSALGKRVNLQTIAAKIDSPTAFTSKVLQQLANANIIDSITGPTGGFMIKENKLRKIRLSEVVMAIDGSSLYEGCALGFAACNEKVPCPIHHHFKKIRNQLKTMLESTRLADLASDIEDGLVFLKQ